jgi:hypothetical protein
MQQPPHIDIGFTDFVIALLAYLLGAQLAAILSPYVVIIFGWAAGAIIGVFRRDVKSSMSTFWFVVGSFMFTVGLTGTAADLAAKHVPWLGGSATAILFPVAAAIPAFADKWDRLFARLWSAWAARAQKRAEGGEP